MTQPNGLKKIDFNNIAHWPLGIGFRTIAKVISLAFRDIPCIKGYSVQTISHTHGLTGVDGKNA